ncbi:MAG: PBP1A family penicillin-binding protein [Verrucomicrobiales bacterium]|nr:PBP1A family penicillin-binding protein [Verrucomicrobiales bacterium]
MSDDELPNRWGFLGNTSGEKNEDQPAMFRVRPSGNDDSSSSAGRKVDPGHTEPLSPIAAQAARRQVEPVPGFDDVSVKTRKKAGFFVRFVIYPAIFFGVIGIIAFLAGAIYFHSKALVYDLDDLKAVPERTLVYDRNGELMGHVSGHGQNRQIVPVSKVSQNFIKPLLAREDIRFYKHGGVDYLGVARAALTNIKSGKMDQGASTLTMQLARNSFGMTDKTLLRKAKEVALAKRLERTFKKDEILSYYVNRIYFGSGLYGIERASQGYFMKAASELTLSEGAMLAGVIRGPSLLNPFRDLEAAKGVRNETLARMVAEEMITPEQAAAAKAAPVNLRPPEMRFATGSYVLQEIHNFLSDALEGEDAIKQGGLRVYCTIDSKMQKAAEEGLDGHLTKLEERSGWDHPKRKDYSGKEVKMTNYVQGAVVSLDNSNGAILSYVGGRSFNESPFNRAVNAKRQAGSTFKPFVYAVAFDRGGLLPGTYVSDGPIQYRQENGKIWSPKNYDGTYQGNKPAAWGLIKSRNTMSIRVGQMAGMDNIQGLANRLYFGKIPESPVTYLGAFECTPMTMTSAFSTLASGGTSFDPYLIERIENSHGDVLFQYKPRGARVFSESVAWMTTDVLGKVFSEGTARSARSTYGYTTPSYGKTGTTNDNKDAWFVGYTDKVTTGVWVGLDNPKTIMYKGTGSSVALPIWTHVMKEADECGYKGEEIAPPPGSEVVHLCRECGLRASRKTTDQEVYQMRVPRDLLPKASCAGHQKFTIFSKSPEWYKQQKDEEQTPPASNSPAPVLDAFKKIGSWFNKNF